MATRQIRLAGDPILTKECKEVKALTPMLSILIEDMLDTMYEMNGVGLAAPQVGILKRIAVVDIGDGPVVMVNPVILEEEGEQTGDEACLSFPGKAGSVSRPNRIIIRAFDEHMTEYEMEAEELLARAFCHEIEHLDGHMYMEHVIGELHEVTDEDEPPRRRRK